MAGHQDPEVYQSRYGVLIICRCGWKSKAHPTAASASVEYADHVRASAHSDGEA